jgi:hypothetical protein
LLLHRELLFSNGFENEKIQVVFLSNLKYYLKISV